MANDERIWNIVFQSRVTYATMGTTNLINKKSNILMDFPINRNVRILEMICVHRVTLSWVIKG